MNVFWKRAALTATALALTMACAGCSGAPEETAPTTTTAPSTTVVTTTTQNAAMNSEVNVRSGPGFEYEVLGGVPAKQPIVIVGREGDWYKIEHGDGYGYVNAHYVDVDGAPEQSAIDHDETIALLTAIASLPDIYRQTILLYYYDGFKAEEIARIQHTAKSTVNVRLKRGRDLLRKILEDDEI